MPEITHNFDKTLRVAMVAGEASGDMLGAQLMEAMIRRYPRIEFFGIGGPHMEARGLRSMVPQEKLAVRGYAEVLKHLPELLRIRKELRANLIKSRPDVFVGIDAPDFNLPLEAKLKQAGIPTVHYVSPSVWAWRPERIQRIARAVSKVLCLFPMEPPLYVKAGVPVSYVGHPLASEIPLATDKEAMREQLALPKSAPIFALLPGSRISELDYMAPIYIETAKLLLKKFPEAQFIVPLATRATRDRFDAILTRLKAWELPIRKLFGHAQMAIIASDVVLVTSGTATLEVALCKRPMVISYKLSTLTYWLVKHKLRLPYVGLPNILCERAVVPELLQKNARPEKLAAEIERIYHDKDYQDELTVLFDELQLRLRMDTSTQAAEDVLQVAQ
ncbi:MAG: lipid-A-disaccharide synthase [Paludibacterium sp.]|uniref:lipid-A-disaccharide synthase n=1 Tax=Paludibacterium sp. TaxID=1917523 RepID=UPI0026012E5B|nr:lipid-A-disaccharide synthase [Paludibacterium sp.]MBV8048945.1 lipid-A-disaccharide synthase [Paludibacterium sp.]MBV8646758.1 lipid-A-disaccharide synthase [Paludibacterium sp.]